MNLQWSRIDSFTDNTPSPLLSYWRPCPICNSARQRGLDQIENFQFFSDSTAESKRMSIRQALCLDCFAVFLNPSYSSYGFGILFREGGRSYGATQERPHEQRNWLQSRNLLAPGSFVLDVGCGTGAFLLTLSPSVRRLGVDIDEPSIREARRHAGPSIEFEIADFESFRCTEAPDLITMFHVLEHLTNPVRTLRSLRAIAKAETRLVIEVPLLEAGETNNANGTFGVQHLTQFTRTTLQKCLSRAGWTIEEWASQSDYNGTRVMANPGTEEPGPPATPDDLHLYRRVVISTLQAASLVERRLLTRLGNAPRCVIWGAGLHTEFLYQTTLLFHAMPSREYLLVDSDPLKHETTWRGVPVLPPEALKARSFSGIPLVISSYGSQEQIVEMARDFGVAEAAIIKPYETVRRY